MKRRQILSTIAASLFINKVNAQSNNIRLISLGGAFTECVYLLGGQENIIATDITSTYPEKAALTKKVGYFRQLSAEGILSLSPNVILADSQAGPPRVLEQIKNAGVKIYTSPQTNDINEVINKIKITGQALNLENIAKLELEKLEEKWQNSLTKIENNIKGKKKLKAIFILGHGAAPSVAGINTAADALINLIGCENAMKNIKGYRPMTAEALAIAAPDIIISTDEGIKAQGGEDKLWQRQGMQLTPAYKSKKILSGDALGIMGFTPRLPEIILNLNQKAYAG